MQRLFYFLLVCTVVIFAGFTAPMDEVLAGTVRIETFSESGSLKGRGSGFFISDQGLIVTNHHVMEGAASAIIYLSGGREFRQVIVEDFDEHKDLVLLRVEGIGLPALSLGKSTESKTGDKVWVLGNTLGEYGNSVSQGVISGIRHNDAGFKYLQFTAAISPGNSGGPVLNENYEVVGVAAVTRTDGQNVNFAIPVNYVLGMVENRRGLNLAQYREMSGKGSVHLVRRDRNENLVHPDIDLARRVVIVPFNAHTESGATGRNEMFVALALKLKEMFPSENLVVVEGSLVQEAISEQGRDVFDTYVRQIEPAEIKQLAVRLRANTVIYGTINNFSREFKTEFVPFVGFVSGWQTRYNVDVSLYKLDRDKTVFQSNLRKAQGDIPVDRAAIDISATFYSRLKKEFESFSATNLYGDKPLLLKSSGNDFRLLPQTDSTPNAARKSSRKAEMLERLRKLSGS